MKFLYISFLFLISFLIRVLIWVFPNFIFLMTYDTFLYLYVGLKYVDDLIRYGDLKVLLLNYEHPPLAKFIIGLSILLFKNVDYFHACIITFSIMASIVGYIIYKIGTTYDENVGIFSWMLYIFDPFSIQWTMAWLDMPMLTFLIIGIYLLYYSNIRYREILSGIMFGLSFLCKYTSILIILSLMILYHLFKIKNIRSSLKPLIIAFIILFANPQYWIGNDFIFKIMERNREVGNISIPIAFYPYFKPLSIFWIFPYIWCFSYCNIYTLPTFIPIICFIALLYRKFSRKSLKIDLKIILWLTSTLMVLSLLPKHYVYYNIILMPPLILLATNIILSSKNSEKESIFVKIVKIPVGFLIALSPLQLIISIIFPTGWLFIWDIIINQQIMGFHSIIALILTFLSFIWSIIFTHVFL